ncbi:MAG: hypothetical protein AAF638_10345 [Pseudomonadota bacterium]
MKQDAVEKPDAIAFGRAIPDGLSVNLLVSDMATAIAFAETVLAATIRYADDAFAIVSACGSTWMLHQDRTYRDHPMAGIVEGLDARGAGAEIRLHGRDPDAAEAAARATDHIVLAGAMDKPHGRREAFILDPDGYVWVCDIADNPA